MRNILLVTLLAVLLVAAGCVQTGGADIPLMETASKVFADVIVPIGFTISYSDSFHTGTPSGRAGVLRYSGSADMERIVTFYKERMPRNGWELKNTVRSGTEEALFFKSGSEGCAVIIKDSSTFLWKTVDLTIIVF